MVDREQLEALLTNRFPGATREQIAAAANAIMAMVRAERIRQTTPNHSTPAVAGGGLPPVSGAVLEAPIRQKRWKPQQ